MYIYIIVMLLVTLLPDTIAAYLTHEQAIFCDTFTKFIEY